MEHNPEKCAAVSRLREALAGLFARLDASAAEARSGKIMLDQKIEHDDASTESRRALGSK
jgi:hypothetical protein